MNKFLTLVLLAAYTAAGPADVQPSQNLNCLEYDNAFFSCMFVKTITALNRAARSSNIEIIDGVTFVRDTPMERLSRNLEINEKEIMNELPRENTNRMIKIFNMLYDSVVSFMNSHSLKFDMPEGSVSRALTEGRGKIKKLVLPLIAAAGLKVFAFAPLLLLGLGLITIKALIFGKFALLAAGYMIFQKLLGGSSVGSLFNRNPPPIWYDHGPTGSWAASSGSPGSQQQGYRSFDADAKVDAQNLAYSAHVPTAND
ncbi:PREDICTED: uncharacterized protein LOC108781230 [Cyphomyrmex costatus]|uniref:Uncharacterized protein n=1 Tax=Cyphomyrmex costatus TaxID=456900 RepID=A0A195C1D2_9HYME|nr:PREDICTED: uncharacterized protein LOC108781230 [Cyphomyrmex costatus]KYM94425.1 hypothetical protein ALC62_14868 [Cyphomyrmex costatus]